MDVFNIIHFCRDVDVNGTYVLHFSTRYARRFSRHNVRNIFFVLSLNFVNYDVQIIILLLNRLPIGLVKLVWQQD